MRVLLGNEIYVSGEPAGLFVENGRTGERKPLGPDFAGFVTNCPPPRANPRDILPPYPEVDYAAWAREAAGGVANTTTPGGPHGPVAPPRGNMGGIYEMTYEEFLAHEAEVARLRQVWEQRRTEEEQEDRRRRLGMVQNVRADVKPRDILPPYPEVDYAAWAREMR